jgi:hypothetical protein
MPNILIRDVADTDADTLKALAAKRGTSVQKLVAELVHSHASAERNRTLIEEHGQRLAARRANQPDNAAAVEAALAEAEREGEQRTAELLRLAGIEL